MTRLFPFIAIAALPLACSSGSRVRAPLPGDTTTEALPSEPARESASGIEPGSTSPRAEMNALPDQEPTVNTDDRADLFAIRDPVVAGAPPPPPSRTGARMEPADGPVSNRSPSDVPVPPMSRANADPDLRVVQQIRDAVMKDDSLSFRAKSVKIIATEGKVTLRGFVENEREWTVVDEQAVRFAGAGNVDNQIEVRSHKR